MINIIIINIYYFKNYNFNLSYLRNSYVIKRHFIIIIIQHKQHFVHHLYFLFQHVG
jgi:hypothetical protein